ncbi:MAG: ABC transporter permease [Deltaproteobacteria bacterium]|nr:ABC transporter permease [Deltaproteobacteria bacterium]
MIFSKLQSFIAHRYLRSKRKEVFISIITIISILGVAISVLVLNITLAVMTGFETELKIKLLDANAHIFVRKYGSMISDWPQVVDRLVSFKEIETVQPYTYNQALITGSSGAQGIVIRGVADLPGAKKRLDKILQQEGGTAQLFAPTSLEITRPDGQRDTISLPPLIIGEALRARLSLDIGDPVTVMAPSFAATPQGLTPKSRRFIVVGTYHSGLTEYETGVAYTSMTEAQHFFNLDNQVTGIEIMVQDMFKAKVLAKQVNDVLGGRESQFVVTDWTDMHKALWEAIQLEKRVYFIVLLLLILIASFSIVSTLVMMVMEKSKDIAILKALGAANSFIAKVFLLQGIIIGVVGALLGTVLGYLGCIALREYGFPINPAVFSLDKVPVYIERGNFIAVAMAAFVITSLAGIYPARRASKINPAEILRYE